MTTYLFISIFGLFGIFARFGIDRLILSEPGAFPRSTFLINILGCFLAGVVYAWGEQREISPALQVGLLVGFCGGFTTFSAYALQVAVMLDRDRFVPALAYVCLSPLLGVVAAFAPILIARKLFS